ncbi:MAG: HAMP domain-containing histidine kinase [Verrucomicrobiales bacterium]|nr:HAMP domain-containing histidine kinase [Verrucomicrobiales bacterium]
MAEPDPSQSFFFADHLVLDDSSTREFYIALLQGLIHKNNNMLGVIQGFSSLILMDDDIPSGITDNVTQMKDSAQGASDLARGILTTSGCARLQIEAVDLNGSMPYFEQTCRELAAKEGIEVQFNRAENLPPVLADSTRLLEMLRELGENAIEAAAETNPPGEVAIDVLPPGEASPADQNRVDIFIRNSSVEIAVEKIPELFMPFYSEKGNEHNGVGLTTAGVLAGQMDIRLGFRYADGTTTVWLSLPTAE